MLESSMSSIANRTFANLTRDDEEEYVPYDQRPETYVVPIVFFLIFVVGVMGNGMLVLTLLRYENMRNAPNIYVLSLAIGDLLVRLVFFYMRLWQYS